QNIKEYESLMIKQVHYWWSKMAQAEYRSSDNELASVRLFLQNQKQEFLFFKEYVFAFVTAFFDILLLANLMEFMVDAAYNTNKSKYELYGAMVIIN
ncbi:12310_t:CDS:1, partial [Racocetra persica]